MSMSLILGILAALEVNGYNVGNFLWIFVGLAVLVAIVWAILNALGMPPVAFKILYVVGLVLLFIVAISFFFGGGVHVST